MGSTRRGNEQTAMERILLREGFRFPWKEALTEARWKPWVWWLLRIVPVVIILTLISLGIVALTHGPSEDFDATELVAFSAVLVAGLSVAVTGASVWFNYRGFGKRLAHEVEMQAEQFAHERTEAVRQKAAEAYASAYRLLWKQPDEWTDYELGEVSSDLAIVMAVGWNAPVRVRATRLDEGLDSIMYGIIGDRIDNWDRDRDACLELLEKYRKAIRR